MVPIVPRWAFPFVCLGLLGSKDGHGLNQSLVDRVHRVTIKFVVLINHFVIELIVHGSISLFPCAIGVANPVFDLVLDEVSDAGPTIAIVTLTVKPCVIIIVRPCGLNDEIETIAAVRHAAGCAVVHVSIPLGPFLLLGRTNIGAVANHQAHTNLFGSRPYFLRSYQKILLINYY